MNLCKEMICTTQEIINKLEYCNKSKLNSYTNKCEGYRYSLNDMIRLLKNNCNEYINENKKDMNKYEYSEIIIKEIDKLY